MHQLSLRPWPVTADHYQSWLNNGVRLEDLHLNWLAKGMSVSHEDVRPIYAVIEFLISHTDVPVVVMQRELVQTSRSEYWSWLHQFADDAYITDESLERAWLRFVFDHSTSGRIPTLFLKMGVGKNEHFLGNSIN